MWNSEPTSSDRLASSSVCLHISSSSFKALTPLNSPVTLYEAIQSGRTLPELFEFWLGSMVIL